MRPSTMLNAPQPASSALDDLAEDDAVQEPAESEAHDEAGRARHDHVLALPTGSVAQSRRAAGGDGPRRVGPIGVAFWCPPVELARLGR